MYELIKHKGINDLLTSKEFEQAVPYLKALKDKVGISEGYAENAGRFLKQFGDTIDDVQLPRWEYGEYEKELIQCSALSRV